MFILNNKKFISIRGHYFCSSFISSNSTIVDLGSHLGEFSYQISQIFKCKCHAVEAYPELFNLIKVNSLIVKHNFAISDKNDYVKFSIAANKEASCIDNINCRKNSTVKSIDIMGITFQKFIKIARVSDIDLLKVDIEGAEILLFKSIEDKELAKIKQITIEFHDFKYPIQKEVENITRRLENLGFYKIKFSYLTNGDVLFVNSNACNFSYFDYLKSKYFVKNILGFKRVLQKHILNQL